MCISGQAVLFQVGVPSWLMVAALLALVLAALAVARLRKHADRRWDVKICRDCGANNPPHAQHCSVCGRKLTHAG